MDEAEIDRIVTHAVAERPAVLAAWIFGSRARGEGRPGSDIDVAVLTDGAGSGDVVDGIAADISVQTGLEADVCRLELASPVLGYEIVTGGRRIFGSRRRGRRSV
jgi:predicted nucleotidyltransferase